MTTATARTITVTRVLTNETLDGILATAYEGGIGYWLRGLNHEQNAEGYAWVAGYEKDDAWEASGLPPFCGSEPVDDWVEAGNAPESVHLIDRDTIALGIQRVLAGGLAGDYILAQVVTVGTDEEDIDADAADCIVQAGVFGEIVYG